MSIESSLQTLLLLLYTLSASLVAQVVKNLPAMWETQIWSLGQEDPLEEGHGNPLQYSDLENTRDRGAWRATVHGIAKESDTTEQLTLTQALTHPFIQLVSTKGNFTICVLATAASSSFFLLLSLVSRSVSQNVFWGALVFKTVYELKVKQIWGTPLLAHLHVKDWGILHPGNCVILSQPLLSLCLWEHLWKVYQKDFLTQMDHHCTRIIFLFQLFSLSWPGGLAKTFWLLPGSA